MGMSGCMSVTCLVGISASGVIQVVLYPQVVQVAQTALFFVHGRLLSYAPHCVYCRLAAFSYMFEKFIGTHEKALWLRMLSRVPYCKSVSDSGLHIFRLKL